MITDQDVEHVIGQDVVGPDEEKIGSVDTIYLDNASGQPAFALVNTGLLGHKSSFVPLDGADVHDDQLRVQVSKDQVKDAPSIDADDNLEPETEQQLLEYYGLGDDDQGPAPAPGTARGHEEPAAGHDRAVGHDVSGPTTDDAMTRSEEELEVGTERRETGRARLRKYVVTEYVTRTVPVEREEVRVEREPITDANVDAATEGSALSEEEHEVVLHEEEPVVEKRTVPKERVRLEKDVVPEEREVDAELSHEEIEEVDQDADEGDHR